MDTRTVVIDGVAERDRGDALIRALVDAGFPVDVAFWAQADGDDRRFLYVASPALNAGGSLAAYRSVDAAVRRPGSPGLWTDSFDIKLVSPVHPMAVEARDWRDTTASALDADSVEWDGKPHPNPYRMIHLSQSSLGGMSLEGRPTVYPPYPPGLAPRATP